MGRVGAILATLLLLPGCMCTNYVEQSRVVRADCNESSDTCCLKQRSWLGPWLCMPDKARP